MHRLHVFACGALIVGGLAGCGGDDSLEVVEGAPSIPSEAPARISLTAAEDVTAIGAKGSRVVVGTQAGVYIVNEAGTELLSLSVWSDDPAAPTEPGPTHAFGRRTENVLVAAEGGLFHTSGDKLLVSPASASVAGLGVASLAAEGAAENEKVWIGGAGGLYELKNGALTAWAIEGQSAAPNVITPDGALVFVAFGDKLYELDTAAGEAKLLPHSFGAIHAIARGAAGSVYVAADQGLFERRADGGYTQYTLSDGDPKAAWGAVFDPKKGMFAVTAAGVVLAQPGNAPVGVAALPGTIAPAAGAPAAAADDIGTVWIGAGKSLEGLKIGSTVAFEADVEPILANYCASCHATGAQYSPKIDFSDYETTKQISTKMIQRISAGQMPPSSSPAMPAEAFDVLLRWEASGRNR